MKLFNDEELYSVNEVAQRLKVTKDIVYSHIKKGLPAFKVGGLYRLKGSDLNEFITYHDKKETEKEDEKELTTV